jgi:hypothetical protein
MRLYCMKEMFNVDLARIVWYLKGIVSLDFKVYFSVSVDRSSDAALWEHVRLNFVFASNFSISA